MLRIVVLGAVILGMSAACGRLAPRPALAAEPPVEANSLRVIIVSMDCQQEYMITLQDNRYVRFTIDREACSGYEVYTGREVVLNYVRYKNGALEVREISPAPDAGDERQP